MLAESLPDASPWKRVRSPQAIAFAGLAALAIAMGIGRFAFTPILPMMQDDAGLSVADGGWLASANYLGYLLGALSAVVIRIPAEAAIRWGLTGIGILTLMMGFVHGFGGWVALRAGAGVASAWVMISVAAWCLEKLTPLRRSALNSTVFAGVGAGIMAAGTFCLLLMYRKAGSTEAWIGLGGLSLAVTAATWRVFGGRDGTLSRGGRGSADRYRWDADSIRLVLCYGAFGFGYIIPATFVPVMARQVIRDPTIFGWAWPVFGAAAAASTFSGALSSKVGGNRRLWMVSQVVMAVGVALPVLVPGTAGVMLAALCVGGTFMVNTMGGMQEAREVAGPDATRLMAAMTAAFALGQVAGPALVSHLVGAKADFSVPLLIASGVLMLSACALARRHPGSTPTASR